jgi:hypothetical protein
LSELAKPEIVAMAEADHAILLADNKLDLYERNKRMIRNREDRRYNNPNYYTPNYNNNSQNYYNTPSRSSSNYNRGYYSPSSRPSQPYLYQQEVYNTPDYDLEEPDIITV